MAVRSITTKDAPTKMRKNPPSFRHLPRDRASKLKKAWLEKKKLKARWRTEKRREGLPDSGWNRQAIPQDAESSADHRTQMIASLNDHEEAMSDDEPTTSTSLRRHGDADVWDKGGNDSEPQRPPLPRKRARTTVLQGEDSPSQPAASPNRYPKSRSKQKQFIRPTSDDRKNPNANKSKPNSDTNPERSEEPSSLRELTRRAYAPSSLHTFKSDPLHRRKGKGAVISKGGISNTIGGTNLSARTPNSKRGSWHSHDGQKGELRGRGGRTPRGQPNMKLRMEAMLERIKRDF